MCVDYVMWMHMTRWDCPIWTFFPDFITIVSAHFCCSIQLVWPWIQATSWDFTLGKFNSGSGELWSNDKNSCSDYYVDGGVVSANFSVEANKFASSVIVCNMLDVRVQMHGFNWKCPELSIKRSASKWDGFACDDNNGLNISFRSLDIYKCVYVSINVGGAFAVLLLPLFPHCFVFPYSNLQHAIFIQHFYFDSRQHAKSMALYYFQYIIVIGCCAKNLWLRYFTDS